MMHELQRTSTAIWCDRCTSLWPVSQEDEIPVECVPTPEHVQAYLADRSGLAWPMPFEMRALSPDEIARAVGDGPSLSTDTLKRIAEGLRKYTTESAPCRGVAFPQKAPCRCYYIAPELRAQGQRCSPCVAQGILGGAA